MMTEILFCDGGLCLMICEQGEASEHYFESYSDVTGVW